VILSSRSGAGWSVLWRAATHLADYTGRTLMGLVRELQEIWSSDRVSGLERYTALALRSSMFLSLGYWVTRLFSDPIAYSAIELYVLLWLAVLLVVINSAEIAIWSVVIASYCGIELYAYLLNIVFTSKYRSPSKVKSVERSLLLFFLNAAEINVWFGVLYRFTMPNLKPQEAFQMALLVFGTLGTPQPEAKPEFLDLIVIFQIGLDFIFIVILAGSIVGKLRAFDDR
jgi:hypothetical protein